MSEHDHKPFGINLTILPSVSPPPYADYRKAIIDSGVKIVETAGYKPQEHVDGLEAAGHPGEDDVPALVLLPAAADKLRIPILASGDYGDARGPVAALALGADGMNMGTRFGATIEAPIHESIKQLLVNSDERATNLIFRTFRNTGRVIQSSVSDKVVEIGERLGAVFADVQPLVSGALGPKALETGDAEVGLGRVGRCWA